jgi:hypothetical protein
LQNNRVIPPISRLQSVTYFAIVSHHKFK